MSNKQVAIEWRKQNKKTAHSLNMYFDDETIFSYGNHFPMGYITDSKHDGKTIILQNSDRYSSTTQRHLSHMRAQCYGDAVIEVMTQTLKNAITEYRASGKLSEETIDRAATEINARLKDNRARQERARTRKDIYNYPINQDLQQLEVLQGLNGKPIVTSNEELEKHLEAKVN